MPDYTIHPLFNGRCVIAGHHAFHEGDPAERYPYALYLWLILGGDEPVVVDTGLDHVAEMNEGAAHVLAGPIIQAPGENAHVQLTRFGLTETDIGAVILTHLHFDHVDRLHLYRNARIYVSGRGLAEATAFPQWRGTWAPHKTLTLLTATAEERTVAADDAEVAPGIRTLWLGGHSPCSQGVLVDTRQGTACLTGDTVSLLKNLETNTPVGVYHDLDQCRRAMDRVREAADIVLPGHDPQTLTRFPEGVG